MKNLIYLMLGVMALLLTQACHNEHGKNYNDAAAKVDQDGLSFIKNGIEGSLAEIKASGVAITKTSNQRVIGFAKMMIDDHTKAGDELKKIETDKQLSDQDTISSTHQQAIIDLSLNKGGAFDRAYMQLMVTDHIGAVKLFTRATQNADNEISAFAKKTLPAIQMHLDSANAILISLK